MRDEAYQKVMDEINAENLVLAERLEMCIELLQEHIRCLRREEDDTTGIGRWRMFVQNLEWVAGVKVITEDQYKAFVKMCEEKRG